MSDPRTREHDGLTATLSFWCEVCERWLPNFRFDEHEHSEVEAE